LKNFVKSIYRMSDEYAYMAANQDKVEKKAVKELQDKIRAGRTSSEMEKELNNQDVAYKIKNRTAKQ
jgi:hypothetical protein